MAKLYNRARVTTGTMGTGTMTLGGATAPNYCTFAETGVQNNDIVTYLIEDSSNFEIGVGTYTASGTKLTRDTVSLSKINGTAGTGKISLSGNAIVSITAAAADLTTMNTPIGGLFVRPTAAGANSVNYRMIVNENPVVGPPAYTNEVVSMGWNLSDTVGVPGVTGQPMNFDTWEFKFNNGSVFGCERHITVTDTSGTQHRVSSYFMPHDWTNSVQAGLSHILSYINFNDDSGAQQIKWDLHNKQAFLGNSTTSGFVLNFNANNTATLQQNNAAGNALLKLPFIDANNALNIQQAPFAIGPRNASISGFAFFELVTPTNGDSLINLAVSGTAVATLIGLASSLNATSQLLCVDGLNTGTGDTNIRIAKNNVTSGDASLLISNFGQVDWALGIDTDDSNKFKLSRSATLGTSDVWTVDSKPQVAFTYAPKVPVLTVGTLPAAATAGSGAKAVVTDANATTFASIVAAGGTNIVPVYSNGTNWIIG